MQSKQTTLLIIVAIMALSGDLRAFNNRNFFTGSGPETWEMLDRISKAEEMMALQKYGDAKILADSLAGKYPDSEDVKKLQQCAEGYLKSGGVAEEKSPPVEGPAAEDLWAEYQTAERNGDLETGRRMLIEIISKYKNPNERPVFYGEVAARLKKIESKIVDILSGKKESIENMLSAAKEMPDHKSKMEMCLGAAAEAGAILEKYDGLGPFVAIKGRTDDCLEDAIRIAYGRARVLADLDGCPAAIPQYAEILNRTELRNYTVYVEAENEYKKCTK